MRRHRLIVVTVLVLAAALGAAMPLVAAGVLSPYLTAGGQPHGAILGGQYTQLVTADCPLPARMLPDEPYPYACPPPVKLPVLPGRSYPIGR